MLLGNYFTDVNKKYKNFFFSGISFDTKKIKKDHIFFAIKGNRTDGNDFIRIAIQKGSRIIITEKKIKKFSDGILYIQTKNIRKLLSEISFKIYNKKPNNLIAVTGTNGKSSVADFYYQILKLNNIKVASIGTLGVQYKNFKLDLSNTTIDPIRLGKILTNLKSRKVENVIMEASSHGLDQNRLDGLSFNTGIFTNLSQDHLDYHKSLKNYLKAKLYLFKRLVKKRGNIITDKIIFGFENLKKISKNRKLNLYTLHDKNKNQFEVISHSFQEESQLLKVKYNNSIREIKINLIGKIQLTNVMMAIIAAKNSNINLDKILKVISKLKSVEGRFEKIGNIKNRSKVILDYAHTPDALKTCLLNLREQFPDKKLTVLFGCGGNRDQNKRSKMGKIASDNSDNIILTDDNPRFENPKKIRGDIKKGIKKKFLEIPSRSKAIFEAIKNLNSGDILLVAGKGHEKTQDVKNRKFYFSDRNIILNSIRIKNKNLSKNLKLNIIKEVARIRKTIPTIPLGRARINSQEVLKNDIFFAIKGKKNDGNKFVVQSFKKKASLAIVNRIHKKININRQIEVKNTLKFLTEISKIFRNVINTKIVAITGSCGKTTLKELLGNVLRKISKVSISPRSYNNKFGVPLSLINLKQSDDFGILEAGMDKKGEIDYLTKIIKPNVGVITNINYAHAKNFKNIKQIALAKSEIINNIRPNGFLVLNADDSFFSIHKKIAMKRNLNVISFGIKNKIANIRLVNIKQRGKKFKIQINFNNNKKYFLISDNFQNNIYNILAALAVISIYLDIFKLNKNIFLDFKIPGGRGDHSIIKINNKKINLIDQSYNSNPLSLRSAIMNYDKINTKKSNKYLLLGDMLELGKHSEKLHKSIIPLINQTDIDKVFVKGKMVSKIFKDISIAKKGKIFADKSEIIKFISNDLNNNDYLMMKASFATGFNNIVKDLKELN